MLSGFTRYLKQHVLPHFVGVLEFLQPALQSLVDAGGTVLTQAAEQAVAAVAADPAVLTNSDKRDAAINAVLGTLRHAGIVAGENAVRIAVEAAVAKVKSVASVEPAAAAPVSQDGPAGTLDAGVPTE